ncbi:gamma-interferon-inducible lysosomal thiol reductase [Phtheirospermum japonicum]|uniref:Gamma-interferon-inducible lysosomal thiol reductase n=1 Tax=Phtheirospermum japonicum TaxID=374723 RepID=A0A830BB18_9LAMI|nr:gamma-interferon-inducible lysosomal thiol reductase [Phtheirospermum japonicum]
MDALRLLLILSIISSSSCFSTAAASNNDDKVTLALYYESLCPYCSNLIVNYLYKLFDSDIISITDLKLIPYGNAKIKPNSTITCQHGPWECLLNTVESCAIDAWPDVKDHFPFIYCVESLVYEHNYTYWETCFEKLGLDASPVTRCLNSDRGTELELAYAAETSALQPPHKYVPWVVVDGQPLYDDYRNFVSYICKAYKGTAIPSACSSESSSSRVGQIRKVKMNVIGFLFGEDTSKSNLFQTVLTRLRRNKISTSS